MKGPFRRGADSDDERMQRRLREIAERADRTDYQATLMAVRLPVPPPPTISRARQTYAPPPTFAPPRPPPPFVDQLRPVAPRPRTRWVRRTIVGLLCFLVVMLVLGRIAASGPQGWTSEADPKDALSSWPAPPEGIGNAPLGEPPADVPDADSYEFMQRQDGWDEPVTYNPCAPIHYVVNDRMAFDGAERELDAAVEQIEQATGLVFVKDGATEEAPIKNRAVVEKRYGKSWSPVLVAWSDRYEYGGLKGALGRGGSSAVEVGGNQWFVSGIVVLNGPRLRQIYGRKDGPVQVRAVLMHELGHLVGLHHVSARGEIMKPGTRDETATWGPGDRAGLARLGDGHCMVYY